MKLSYPNLLVLHFQKFKSISISLSPQILGWRNFILEDQLVPAIPNHPTCNTKSVKIRRSQILWGNLHFINKTDLIWLPKTIPEMSLHPNRLCKKTFPKQVAIRPSFIITEGKWERIANLSIKVKIYWYIFLIENMSKFIK